MNTQYTLGLHDPGFSKATQLVVAFFCEYYRKISLTSLTKVEGEAITVPATMRDKLETWLQHDQSLLATAERQRVIHITNKGGNHKPYICTWNVKIRYS